MKKKLTISVFEIVGSPLCVASGDGQKVFSRLVAALNDNREIILSFGNVTILTSAFLNTAIGQLYGTMSEEKIRSLLHVEDMQADDIALLKRVIDTAKQYFADPNKFEKAIHDVIESNQNEKN
ncbi:STAS-like domain-containing protein [Legionella sp. CNM-4043-24]|uniref:STAS-like domain-containing protein n=1 Tax=Legionella sp. CNM-4043-24 TaxID=3421646 RepID=UPI00403AC816